MIFARIVLVLAALMFALFGAWLLVIPEQLGEWLDVTAASPVGLTEIRAFYGGYEIGLALFLLLGLRRRFTAASCYCLAFTLTCVALSRIYGFFVDGTASAATIGILATEAGFAVLGWLAAYRVRNLEG